MAKVEEILSNILNTLAGKTIIPSPNFPIRKKKRIDREFIDYNLKNKKHKIHSETCLLEKLIILNPGDFDSIRLYDGDVIFFDSVITPNTPKVINLDAICHTDLSVYLDCPDALRHFKCDEAKGQWAIDSSRHLVNANAINFVNDTSQSVLGRVKGGFLLNGSTQYIRILPEGAPDIFYLDKPFSICGWFYIDDSASEQELFNKRPSGEGVRLYIAAGLAGRFELRFSFYDSDGNIWGCITQDQFDEGDKYESDRFHHIVATYDGSGTQKGMKIYINGFERSLEIIGDETTVTLISDVNNSEYAVFGTYGAGASKHFDGILDDLRLYECCLTPAQIKWLFNFHIAPKSQNQGIGRVDEFKTTEFLLIYKTLEHGEIS